jgi:hypothetical protein
MYGIVNIKSDRTFEGSSYKDVNKLLDIEKNNEHVKWSNLILNEKVKKMESFINDKEDYSDIQKTQLKKYVKLCFSRKKLLKDKDVDYSVKDGKILSIKNLNYNDSKKKFTLSNKSLKTTVKNK